jgi:hypothetical protein
LQALSDHTTASSARDKRKNGNRESPDARKSVTETNLSRLSRKVQGQICPGNFARI